MYGVADSMSVFAAIFAVTPIVAVARPFPAIGIVAFSHLGPESLIPNLDIHKCMKTESMIFVKELS